MTFPSRSGSGRAMSLYRHLAVLVLVLSSCVAAYGQQISRNDLVYLTREWKGERFPDGRPKVPDAILDRMKLVTLEEAWAVQRNENFNYQYEGDWMTLRDGQVLVGRAVTATFMPGRPDIHRAIDVPTIRIEGMTVAGD